MTVEHYIPGLSTEFLLDPATQRDAIEATFARRMAARRRELGIRQQDLAEAAACHPTTIGRLEAGQHRPNLGDAVLIARALQVPLVSLLGDT